MTTERFTQIQEAISSGKVEGILKKAEEIIGIDLGLIQKALAIKGIPKIIPRIALDYLKKKYMICIVECRTHPNCFWICTKNILRER